MNALTNNAPRLIPTLLLLGYSVAALFASRLPIPAGWPVATQGLPPLIAPWAGYCIVVGLLCALVDRVDGEHAVGAYPLLGRWFWLAAMIVAAVSIGLALSRIAYADDLLRPARLSAAAIIALTAFVVLAYLSQRRSPPAAAKAAVPEDSRRRLKAALAVALSAVAAFMLHQRYTEKVDRDRFHDQQDADERRAAAPWQHDLDFFRGGETVAEVTAEMQRERYRLRCYGDLRSEERLQADDRSNCWANLGVAWGQPALIIAFTFGDHGLRDYMLRFPEDSWSGVQAHLDRSGRRLDLTMGIDQETGGPIFGWRFDSGLVMSAAPPHGGDVTVAWQAKEEIARRHCPYQSPRRAKANPNGFTVPVTRIWPEIDCDKATYGD